MKINAVGAVAFAICVMLVAAAATPALAGPRQKKKVVRNPDGTVSYVIRGRPGKFYIRQHPYIMENRVYLGNRFESPYSAFFGGNPAPGGPTSW